MDVPEAYEGCAHIGQCYPCPRCGGDGWRCVLPDDRPCPPHTSCPEVSRQGSCGYYRRCLCQT